MTEQAPSHSKKPHDKPKRKKAWWKKLLKLLLIALIIFAIGFWAGKKLFLPIIFPSTLFEKIVLTSQLDEEGKALTNQDVIYSLSPEIDKNLQRLIEKDTSFNNLEKMDLTELKSTKALLEDNIDDITVWQASGMVFAETANVAAQNLLVLRDIDRDVSYLLREKGEAGVGYYEKKFKPAEYNGQLVFEYEEPSNGEHKRYINESNIQLFTDIFDALNLRYKFETDITITLKECGYANAEYEGEDVRAITMCMEFLAALQKLYTQELLTYTEVNQTTFYATLAVLFHELGHALIDVFELPYSGKQEDSVDQLAAVLINEVFKDSPELIENISLAFASSMYFLQPDLSKIPEEAGDFVNILLKDVHSLGRQRYFSTLCMHFGAHPKTNSTFVNKKGHEQTGNGLKLPYEEAQQCLDTYLRVSSFWHNALEQHTR